MSKRKRSQDDYDTLSNASVAQTLARLNGATSPQPAASGNNATAVVDKTTTTTEEEERKDPDNGDDWEVAGGSKRSRKRSKKAPAKEKGNYPEIGHSAHARLQSYVKIYDLQNLVLYLLADGTAPQWCSVRHHSGVKKVVALMVPGLEAGMFSGAIALEGGGRLKEEGGREEKIVEEGQDGGHGSGDNSVLLGAQLRTVWKSRRIHSQRKQSWR
jgi:RNA exonuclease 1